MIPKRNGHIKYSDKTKYMSFSIKDHELQKI